MIGEISSESTTPYFEIIGPGYNKTLSKLHRLLQESNSNSEFISSLEIVELQPEHLLEDSILKIEKNISKKYSDMREIKKIKYKL
jgi:hypothetical protein